MDLTYLGVTALGCLYNILLCSYSILLCYTFYRYSLVMKLSDDEEDDGSIAEQQSLNVQKFKSNLRQSQTYESELDLVLEDLSETATLNSDSESVSNLRISQRTKTKTSRNSSGDIGAKPAVSNATGSVPDTVPRPLSVHDEQMLRYKLLNGCTKYQKLPHDSIDNITHSRFADEDNSRTCKSLPRNMKNVVSNGSMNGLFTTLDSMGSWPRKFSRINSELSKETSQQSGKPSLDKSSSSQQSVHSKRRSLSPGKLKCLPAGNEKTEKIHSLIEEARRMSSTSADVQARARVATKRPPRPMTLPTSKHTTATVNGKADTSVELVSPYASSNVVDTSTSSFDNFIRQPSYKLACSNIVTPRKVLPRSNSEDSQAMKRNYSYRLANKSMRTRQSESILEHKLLESSESVEKNGLVRAPSYRLAQSMSIDRNCRAPSYRKALETIPHETDSGLGSGDLTSSGSTMTSSSESNQSNHDSGRMSSYRAATESNTTKLGRWSNWENILNVVNIVAIFAVGSCLLVTVASH